MNNNKQKIALLAKFVAKKRNSLPALGTVLLKDGKAFATDLEQSITMPFETKLESGCYSIEKLKLSEAGASVQKDFDSDQMPENPFKREIQNDQTLTIKSFEPFERLVKATSNDDLRMILQGLFFDDKNVIATNGRVLVASEHGLKVDTPFILPAKYFPMLSSLKGIDIVYTFENRNTPYMYIGGSSGYVITLKLIEGKYPNYKQVITKIDEKFKSVVLPKSFPIPVKTGKILPTATADEQVLFKDGKVLLQLMERTEIKAEFELDARYDDLIESSCFNAKFVAYAMELGFTHILLKDGESPGICKNATDVYIIMPLRTN